jgi:hypothetical protein
MEAAIVAYQTFPGPNTFGVYATATVGNALLGHSQLPPGIGVTGISDCYYGGYFSGGLAPLALGSAGSPGAPISGTHKGGEFYLDSNAVLWYCAGGGTPGTWVRLTGKANGTVGGAMNFLPGIARIVTSGNTSDPGVSLAVGSPQTFPIAGHNGIPSNATGVFGSATCYASSGSGFVSVFPAGGTSTGGSLNFTASDEPLSNFVATGLGTGGQITVATFASGCKFIYDAVGYTL